LQKNIKTSLVNQKVFGFQTHEFTQVVIMKCVREFLNEGIWKRSL